MELRTAKSGTMEPVEKRVVRITNAHYDADAAAIGRLFLNCKILDTIRGYNARTGAHNVVFVLFASVEDKVRALDMNAQFLLGRRVGVHLASKGTYEINKESTGFYDRYPSPPGGPGPAPLLDESNFPSLGGRKVTHQSAKDHTSIFGPGYGRKNFFKAYSDKKESVSAIEQEELGGIEPSFPPSRKKQGEEKWHSAANAGQNETLDNRNHYDKAPSVFGSQEERAEGYERFLRFKDCVMHEVAEKTFHSHMQRTLIYPTKRARMPEHLLAKPMSFDNATWNMKGNQDPDHNVVSQKEWYDVPHRFFSSDKEEK